MRLKIFLGDVSLFIDMKNGTSNRRNCPDEIMFEAESIVSSQCPTDDRADKARRRSVVPKYCFVVHSLIDGVRYLPRKGKRPQDIEARLSADSVH
jgi:hypothetical protein